MIEFFTVVDTTPGDQSARGRLARQWKPSRVHSLADVGQARARRTRLTNENKGRRYDILHTVVHEGGIPQTTWLGDE
ncbi:hypothetical protein J4U00_gp065 [Mycobacterium phage DyoEdafos]|uniref:Uncharacterized protein n=1 Tax=Mycobacterium phage DyoEdafos TaxID=2599860 RepID=A0A5J6TJW4_9CAUD|nr:hypothetical protein J4U00_gp065 [Mycobacterium phage DyoEdafos]QFG10294.1 hypothetical protein SEA_DYOEDAFOS_65 [Mycobacterium phage DyoEdafos]